MEKPNMNQKERNSLDRYITGNYGEDQFKQQKERPINGHILKQCDGSCPEDNPCTICIWGASICSICGAAEVELEKPCTGKKP
jgi:hypothetical protein